MKLEQLIQGKETFRMAFLGGSITEGAGASCREKRYASRLTAAITRRHPDVKVEEINAGVGGTPSALGMFRMNRDVMEQHHRVAEAYHIPEIDLAADLSRKIRDYGGDYHFFMKDGAHPNDDGYACYTDTIMAHLYDFDFALTFPRTPVSGVDFAAPHMDLAENHTGEGFALSNHSLYGRTPHYLYASTPGSTLTYEFDGQAIGGYITIEKDSGDVAVEIDGNHLRDLSTWDQYALQFNRSAFVLFAEDLPCGHHVLRLTVLPTKNEKSEGTFFRIGAFLVG